MKQIHIISPKRLGLMADLAETLAEAGVNIESIDGEEIGRNAVIVLNVDRYDLALHCLRPIKGIKLITEDAILVKLKNKPGALALISRRFTDKGVNIRSIRFIQRDEEYALVAISTDRTEAALELVADVAVLNA